MIQVLSFWRNDEHRDLEARVRHLLGKTSAVHQIEWLWLVGDTQDETARQLAGAALDTFGAGPYQIIDAGDTTIRGEDIPSRRRRFAAHATELFRHISEDADHVLIHESDLRSPGNVIDRMLMTSDTEPVAGWPTIDLGAGKQFYDVWAYRDLGGRRFSANAPYARGYRRTETFEVGSFGSVWLAPAHLVRGRTIGKDCVVDLCRQWRAEGTQLWCNPTIAIEQPTHLWEPQA